MSTSTTAEIVETKHLPRVPEEIVNQDAEVHIENIDKTEARIRLETMYKSVRSEDPAQYSDYELETWAKSYREQQLASRVFDWVKPVVIIGLLIGIAYGLFA